MAKRKPAKVEPLEIPVIGELFEEQELDIIKAILDTQPGDEVVMYIDSAGGSVYAALTITGLMKLRQLKATAVVLGECSSSALLLFAACQRRLVSARSVFLFHPVKWRSEKDVRSEEAANWAEHFRWLETEIDDYQAKMFGVPRSEFDTWTRQSRFVIGPELVQLGLAELVEV